MISADKSTKLWQHPIITLFGQQTVQSIHLGNAQFRQKEFSVKLRSFWKKKPLCSLWSTLRRGSSSFGGCSSRQRATRKDRRLKENRPIRVVVKARFIFISFLWLQLVEKCSKMMMMLLVPKWYGIGTTKLAKSRRWPTSQTNRFIRIGRYWSKPKLLWI